MKCFRAEELGADGYRCRRTCGVRMSCGRHQCATRCCDRAAGEDHLCVRVCGRTLSCRTHSCELLCHPGACPPCLQATMVDVACACGRTVLSPPVSCGTPAPVCMYRCPKRRPCGHPSDAHTCHRGECPPCVTLVEAPCASHKQLVANVPCSRATRADKVIGCGRLCALPMPCGEHTCPSPCHAHEELALDDGGGCGLPCGLPRAVCGHPCTAKCHPGRECESDESCGNLSR